MNRIAVITGAGAGVGRATATEFARQGYDVALLSRDPDRLEHAAAELRRFGVRALPIPTDVADAAAVEAAADRVEVELGPIDVWVNVAMATVFAPVSKLTPAEFERGTRVTYLGQVHGTMAALSRMRRRNRGTIVNVGSALGYRSVPLQSIYCGAKFAIRGFVDSLRSEIIHDKLDVHLTEVDLPAVNTPQFDWAMNKMGKKAKPVAPIYQPEVPARAIYFAATHRRRQVWVGFPTVQAILANRIAPGLIDRYLAKAGYSGQLTDDAAGRAMRRSTSSSRSPAPTARMAASTAAPGAAAGRCSPTAIATRSGAVSPRWSACSGCISWPSATISEAASMSNAIEDYALIGDGETAALVSRGGSVDWLCWPRFDSDACFAALLGTAENGSWQLEPVGRVVGGTRRYQPDTLVVETEFETEDGAVRLIDFMPPRQGLGSSLVRIVVGLRGRVDMRMTLRMRFDYGTLPPWVEPSGSGVVARVGPDLMALHAPVPVTHGQDAAEASFTVEAGMRMGFVIGYVPVPMPVPDRIDVDAALVATQGFWREWIGRFEDSRTLWPEAVRRSLITCKAMIHRPSGGVVAAPTTSLPEAPGGTMNWDYRYCWLRDASFTLTALLRSGYDDEAERWRDWLLRAIAGTPQQMRIMYRVDGARHLAEWLADGLPGYRHAKPVRIGNAASTQHQVDVFGEVLNCLGLARQNGVPGSDQQDAAILAIVLHLERVWDTPGSGIWESRDTPRRYTYSNAMAWSGINLFLEHRGAEMERAGGEDAETARRLARLRQTIHDTVCREGWNAGLFGGRGSFTQYFGGQELDASLLLLPTIGFLPADDPRMAATIEAIGRELDEGGLIRRTKAKADGPNEGAFLACSCWMADCLALQGRHQEARAQLERVLAVRNDLGLLAEEYDVTGRHLSGNFPQALSHLALINTALSLS